MGCSIAPPATLDDAVEAVLRFIDLSCTKGDSLPPVLVDHTPTALGRAIAQENRLAFLSRYRGEYPEHWDVGIEQYEWRSTGAGASQLYFSLLSAIYQLDEDPTADSDLTKALKQVAESLGQAWFNAADIYAAHDAARVANPDWLRRDGRQHPHNTPPQGSTQETVSTMTMPTEITVALSQLDHSPSNVRAYEADPRIPSIAASLLVRQIHPLLVLPGQEPGRYAVFAGGRRLEALRYNVAAGKLTLDHEVRVIPFEDGEDAHTISLEENFHREPMSPLTEAAAFAAEVGRGKSVDEVALRFGVEPKYVRQRMRLADLVQPVRDALREGVIDLLAAEAYASTPDTDRQAMVFAELDRRGRVGHNPDEIRRRLRDRGVPAGDKTAVYVGLDAYAAAGGEIEEDLFTPASEAILTNSSLLTMLAEQKMIEDLTSLKSLHGFAEVRQFTGWKPAFQDTADLEEVKANSRKPTEDEAKQLDALHNAREGAEAALSRALDAMPAEPTPDDDRRMEQLRAESDAAAQAIRAFEATIVEAVETEGLIAFVTLRNDGTLSPPQLYRRKPAANPAPSAKAPPAPARAATPIPPATVAEDEAANVVTAADEPPATEQSDEPGQVRAVVAASPIISFDDEAGGSEQAAGTEEAPAGPTRMEYNAQIAAHLAFERSAVLKDTLADHPEVAFDLLIFTLASAMFAGDPGEHAAIGLGLSAKAIKPAELGEAGQRFAGRLDLLDHDFLRASNQVEAFQRFREMDEGSKFAWLGYVVADALQPSLDWADMRGSLPLAHEGGSKRVDHAAVFHNHLASMMSLRLRDHWHPTSGNIFERLSRTDLTTALREMGGDGLASGMRNTNRLDLAKTAESLCAGRGHAGPTVVARALAWTPDGMGFPADAMPVEATEESREEEPLAA